jgi:hypothetical protein
MATNTQIQGHNVLAYTEAEKPGGPLLPHKLGNYLWGPMVVMGLMTIVVAFVLSIWQSQLTVDLSERFSAGDKATAASLGHLVPGTMFLGFAFVFAGISFAIARILGVFRSGGGLVQDAVGKGIKTPKMPFTAKVFLVGMMMAMMILILAFAGHIYSATQANDAWTTATGPGVPGDVAALGRSQTWGTWLEGLRRLGVGMYLGSIALGLYTIIGVIRFQTLRIRELATS